MIIQVMEPKKYNCKHTLMKSSALLFFIGMFFVANTANSQNKKTWFDANWKVVSQDKASYYRPTPQVKKSGYWIVDYYLNGKIQKEGFSLTATAADPSFDGLVKYYFENGKPSQQITFKNGKIDGVLKTYFLSGTLKSETYYSEGFREGRYSSYFETGELHERGEYLKNLKEGNWKTYYRNGKIKEKGKYEKGEKIGIWKTYYKNVYK